MPTIDHPSPRAIVIGGSLAGLFAALRLRQTGWDVQVYERSPRSLSGRGAGIVTHPELLGVLRECGIATDAALGVQVLGRRTLDQAGRIIGERQLPQLMTSWDRIYGLLRSSFPVSDYHTGMALSSVCQDEAGVTALFANGEELRGDLLIGADGIRSTVRKFVLPETTYRYAGYVAWRGLVNEWELSSEAHAAIFQWFGFCLPPGEQMLGYPVAGENNRLDPPRRRYNFVWYRPAYQTTVLSQLLMDVDGLQQQLSIPADRIRPTVLSEMNRDADRLLAPQFAEVVRLARQPLIQAICDLEVPRMAFGRIALIGDASFVARPHVGMGVTKAAGDAAALSVALEGNCRRVSEALGEFERARLAFGSAVVRRARELGAYMEAQIADGKGMQRLVPIRTPEQVMAETAVADGIYEGVGRRGNLIARA